MEKTTVKRKAERDQKLAALRRDIKTGLDQLEQGKFGTKSIQEIKAEGCRRLAIKCMVAGTEKVKMDRVRNLAVLRREIALGMEDANRGELKPFNVKKTIIEGRRRLDAPKRVRP